MILSDDVIHKIYKIYYSNNVVKEIEEKINKILNTTKITNNEYIIEYMKPIEIYKGYLVTHNVKYIENNIKKDGYFELSNMYIASSEVMKDYKKTVKDVIIKSPYVCSCS